MPPNALLWLATIGSAAVVFATTNIDDVVVLAAFFADPTMRPRSIIAGQLLGIASLTAASALAATVSLAVPAPVMGVLGLIPLGLGLYKLAVLVRRRGDRARDAAGAMSAPAEPAAHRHGQVLAVTAVTIANGADNLAVYIPLFGRDLSAVPTYAVVFAVMTVSWCGIGYWAVRHPRLGEHVRRYGRWVLPVVLIAVGLHVMWGALPLLRPS